MSGISKQLVSQRLIFKIHSTRLRKVKWNLTLPLAEARRNEEVISLGDSQILRWIDQLNGVEDVESTVRALRHEIKMIKIEPNSVKNRRKVKQIYEKMDEIQFKPDYMCLVIDREKDYWRARKGFTINGVKYVRLLGTNGGVKTSTIVFVSERLAPELRRRIENGRNLNKELVPAKFEAYQALVCSGSTPVSMPKGIAVVNDCVTKFYEDIVTLNDEQEGEPVMEFVPNAEIELIDSDGCGMMIPSLAERWSEDLHLGYITSGVNTRFAWEKGMVFTFDFLEFADQVAGTRIIRDAWGNEVDLSNVELVLTTSMVKLWDSYSSCEEYLRCCQENGYTFAVPKACPEKLENERTTNYQFIQTHNLSDEQIEELIAPTIRDIHDVLGMDWRKTVLFLMGPGMTERDVDRLEPGFAKAIMANPEIMRDPFIVKKIRHLIQKKITDAKIGVLNLHANYSMISGDPYSLCQSMFGLEVTGLLKAGELYNKYWLDDGADRLACFRAPMSTHSNIRLMRVARSEEAQHWYQYMTTCTILNSWDTTTHALNGADKDGDLVFLTDNWVLVENIRPLPALMCAQRKARKCIPTEDDLVQANIDSFGDDIGKTTNRITSMYDVQSQFPEDSEEYKVLEYRIMSGQLLQQNAIDKAKGIISKPMPKSWYDRNSNRSCDIPDEEQREFNLRILADKKPYFMRYIYPSLNKQYTTYINNTRKKCMREFRMSIDELFAKDEAQLSEDERTFLYYYRAKMPVGDHGCVMNRICHRIEKEFDGYISKLSSRSVFDYSIMKSGQEYSETQYRSIARVYAEYNRRMSDFSQYTKLERVDPDESFEAREIILNEFRRQCQELCPNGKTLCDILLDICYRREGTKQLAWDVCAEEIVENLLDNGSGHYIYPVKDHAGEVEYCGERFTFKERGDQSGDSFERAGVCGDGDPELRAWAETGGDPGEDCEVLLLEGV